MFQAETLVQVFSSEFCEISKNTYFYRTPLVCASKWQALVFISEAAVRRCSSKKEFLKFAQYLQENTGVGKVAGF